MKNFAIALSVLLALGGCASTAADDSTTTIVLVRHAEKVVDGSDDPALTADGERHADALARAFAQLPLAAVYATTFRRTQQTAAPTAVAHGLTTIIYDPRQPAAAFAQRLRRDNAGRTALVVGHSNTVPDIAAALCGCAVPAMSEAEYDRLTTVRIDASGKAVLEETRQD